MGRFRSADARTTATRIPQLLAGLVLCGVGIALMVQADLGLSPWDVLHQGIAERTGQPIGRVGIFVGFAVLLVWLPLGERYGVGTLCNVIVIGLTVDATLALLPDSIGWGTRVAYLLVGVFLFGPGSGLYIGAGLGPGPRDGLMTALAARGYSVRLVRTLLEVAVLVAGWALGGSVGVGTVLFALTVGPNVHFFLDRLSVDASHPTTVIGAE